MKKTILTTTLGFSLLLLAGSCKKTGTTPVIYASAEGTWVGNYNNGIGGPIYYYSFIFKAGGALVVNANSPTTPDIANGTWTQAADSISGSYTFTGSSAIYAFAGKYDIDPKVMNGTIGLQPSTSGAWIFTVTKN